MATSGAAATGSAQATTVTPSGTGGWFAALKRAFADYKADNAGDMAAALTYYGVLSIFPALIALLSILGLVGESNSRTLVDSITQLLPNSAQTIFTNAVNGLQRSSGSGIVFVVGILAALWSASGYVSGFMRTSNAIYDVEETRKFIPLSARRLILTIVLVVILVISSVAVVTTGSLAHTVGDSIGVGSTAVQAWDIAKWPVLLLLVAFMITLLYWGSPNVKPPLHVKAVAPGALFAVVVWLLASLLFAAYVAGFSSYNKTYGSLAGVIVFLIWLWITNIALLIGVEFNSELVRVRQPVQREPKATAASDPQKG